MKVSFRHDVVNFIADELFRRGKELETLQRRANDLNENDMSKLVRSKKSTMSFSKSFKRLKAMQKAFEHFNLIRFIDN